MDSKQVIQVKVSDKQKTIFQGEAYAVSSINEMGAFDILWEHANYVTNINTFLDIYIDPNNKKHFEIGSGILRAKLNSVEVFLGI